SSAPPVTEDASENNAPETAREIPIPAAVNGRIESESDVDCFAFQAKKGEGVCIEVIARRRQSSLDSIIRVLDEKGKQLVENDDLKRGKHSFADSLIENWIAPADGKYVVEIRDLQLRGGPTFPYLLKIERAKPSFFLQTDTDKTLIAPGVAAVLFVRAYRQNGFADAIQLGVENLPPGVTADCGRILPDGQDGAIVFTAAEGTKTSIADVRVTGQAVSENSLSVVSETLQEIYMPGGGRGHYPVAKQAISVCEPLDLRKVAVSPTEISLKPGESQTIEVTIERAEGFAKNVSLDVVYQHLSSVYGHSLPKGVVLDKKNSKTLLTPKETVGRLTLKADPTAAPVERQLVPVMAHVSLNFVMKATYAGPAIRVSVTAPEKQPEAK
ncbi:MAG: hypothetical protein N2C14_05430, partial [Planctomycetales bacterium]